MPNHTDNRVTITHKKPAMAMLLMKLLAKDDPFNQIIPMSKLIIRDNWSNAEKEKYGDQNGWYSWCIQNWGTKWDAYESKFEKGTPFIDGDGDEVTVIEWAFETAWSPPIPVFKELVERGFNVHARYLDEGWNYIGEFKNGMEFDFQVDQYAPSHLLDEFEVDFEEMEA